MLDNIIRMRGQTCQYLSEEVMASSIKDVARAAGVSTAAVSIYLNHPDTNRVSAEKKKRIDYFVDKLNYRKNFLASGLSGRQGRIVGVIIPTVNPLFQNDFTNNLLSGAQQVLKEKGYSMLFIPSSSVEDYNTVVSQQLRASGGCDGYFLFSTGFCTRAQVTAHIRSLRQAGKPFVTLNIPEMEGEDIDQVIIPGLSSLSSLGYLYERGHRRILILLGRPGGQHVLRYLEGYKRFLSERGLDYDPGLVVYGNYGEDESRRAVAEVLKKGTDFTAVCCASDLMASCVVTLLREEGLRVPEDVSVTGLDNSIFSRLTYPRITTVDLYIGEAGRRAGELLLDRIERGGEAKKIVMDETLIEGESVRTIGGIGR
jgi:DNA-binding LacI/PurR family transcriptional regulator